MKISRRDTIIIASLVNVSLLALLFATSSKIDDDELELKQEQESLKIQSQMQSPTVESDESVRSDWAPRSEKVVSTNKEPVDEIDQVLQEYALKQKIKVAEKKPESAEEAPAEVKQAPVIKKAKKPISKKSSPQGAQEVEYYIVKSGDNPWKIAKKFGLKYEELLRLNNLDELKAKNLKIGQKLRIR